MSIRISVEDICAALKRRLAKKPNEDEATKMVASYLDKLVEVYAKVYVSFDGQPKVWQAIKQLVRFTATNVKSEICQFYSKAIESLKAETVKVADFLFRGLDTDLRAPG